MTFGLTPQGFNAMRLADTKQALEEAFIAQFGDINLDPQSVFGQEIGVLAKDFADLWENLEDVYFSQYPNSASGISLDNVVQLNGITRLAATQTLVYASVQGNEGTVIPENSIAQIVDTQNNFYAQSTETITAANADEVKIKVGALTAQPYIVILSNQSFNYSLPTITFSNIGPIFVTGNSIVVRLNGVNLPAVPWVTDSNTTLANVAAQIALFPGVASAVAVNPDTINITPSVGFSVAVNDVVITGGATQATSALSFRVPASINAITAALTALINVGTPSWLATDNVDSTFTVLANTPVVPFSAGVGLNLSIVLVSSPMIFLSEDFGPIPAPVGTLTTIVTPIAGWNSITNRLAGTTGTLTETDAQLRIRRQNSIKIFAAATVEAIRARVLQNVPGVTSVTVFENVTLTQTAMTIVFPGQFVAGDIITVDYNTIDTFPVTFSVDQATTMGLLVAAFLAVPEVATATFGGTGNQTVFLTFNQFFEFIIDSISTSVSLMDGVVTGGQPPKSIQVVVEGGTDAAVAEEIWLTKPAGIETYGNANATITDSQGNPHVIYFSRPSGVYLWAQAVLTLYSPETFPPNGLALVAQAILNYGNSLGVGVSVLFQRVQAQVFTVPGIASVALQTAATNLPTDSPIFGVADITLAPTQISLWDLSRIDVTV